MSSMWRRILSTVRYWPFSQTARAFSGGSIPYKMDNLMLSSMPSEPSLMRFSERAVSQSRRIFATAGQSLPTPGLSRRLPSMSVLFMVSGL